MSTDVEVETFRALLRLPTVSDASAEHFETFAATLRDRFPLLHEQLAQHRIGEHSQLLHWRGTGDGDPVVLMAHLDVVPVDEEAWTRPPFGAELADGVLWGRGTLDDKGSLVAICSAVERLLARGFVPARDVWLSLGATEEVSGDDARLAVEALTEHGVRPWFVLDEGGAVAHEALTGVGAPLGVIGVSEKGTTTLELRATGGGGHSSTPAPGGPTARIARAVVRLESRPFPARLPTPTLDMLARVAPHAAAPLRPLLSRAARLRPALERLLPRLGPEAAALTRTTIAVTQLTGSPAHNVIASTATATVNLRLLPGDSVAGAVEHVRRAVDDDALEISVLDANEPSPLSPYDGDAAFGLLADTITEVFPDAVPTPYVMMAATDSRFFTAICERVYRFVPLRMTGAQRESIHAHDEHVRVEDWLDGVRWYVRLLERLPA